MKKFKNARKMYEQIEIPKELDNVVQTAINQSSPNIKGEKPMKKTNIYKIILSGAAAVLIAATIGLNTSESFAMGMQNIPVIGSLAKILTIRSYEKEDADKKIAVKIPAIVEEAPSTTNSSGEIQTDSAAASAITDINAEIQRISDEYVKEAEKRSEEYKQAFLETGGTEEEWKEHDIAIKVDYEIKAQTDRYLSFLLLGTESWSSAYAQTHYYNLDLQTGNYLTLKDILGDDYITIANDSILAQMKERMAADENLSYFDESMDGFTTVTEDTKFYMNETGNPVIVFDKYEIAPGAFGAQEFEILPSCPVQ